MNKKLLTIPALVLAVGMTTLGLSTQASADNIGANVNVGLNGNTAALHVHGSDDNNRGPGHEMNGDDMNHMMPGVFGTVTAVSGSTITVQSKMFKGSTSNGSGQPTPVTTTYTVNASAATVTKANAASTVSAIAVGDTVFVNGTVSGTSVTATTIRDGVMFKGAPGSNGGVKLPTTIPNGNGQPIIGGKVTAVTGNTVTITNQSNVSYTIDTTNAKVTKNGAASTTSTIAVGDNILAQGTVNGTSVTAVNVVDSAAVTTTNTNGTTTTHKGFLGMIGGFFSKLFGF